MIKKALLCEMVASHFSYVSRVRQALGMLDREDPVSGLRGTMRIIAATKDELAHVRPDAPIDAFVLVGCAIDLLVVSYVLRHGRP